MSGDVKRNRFSRFSVPAMNVAIPLLVWATTSCVTPPEGLPKVEGTEQDDIPIPKNFELRSSWSPNHEGLLQSFRTWRGEYAGPGQPGEIVPWYVTEMQRHLWRYKGLEEQDTWQKKLFFAKGEEFAEILVGRELDTKEGGYITVVKARIGQLGPENFTVAENQARGAALEKEVSVQPASYSAKREMESAEPKSEAKAAKGKAAKKDAKTEQASRTQIEDHDGEESPPRQAVKTSGDSTPGDIKELEDAGKDE
jgi:hypothetical protein